MKDRIPTYPGRVKLTPVTGQADTYDMVRADEPVQEGTPLNKMTLLQDATAALYGLDGSAVVDDVLGKLSAAALIKMVPRYTKVSLGGLAEGSVIQLNENGVPVEFYVAKHNYEPDLNGEGRTLLVRKDCYDTRAWHSSNVNAYATSDIDAWFNGDYKSLLDTDVQAAMGETTFYYTPGNGDTTVTTLTRAVFELSLTELGLTHSYANTEGSALPIADILQIAYLNGSAKAQLTRSPHINNKTSAVNVASTGAAGSAYCTSAYGSRPAFTLPADYGEFYVGAGGIVHAEQVYDTELVDVLGASVTVGAQIEAGSYVGTGTYGKDNPNTLTFGFEPKVVFVGQTAGNESYASGCIMFVGARYAACFKGTSSQENGSASQGLWRVYFLDTSQTFSWYNSNSATSQLNNSNYTYSYVAIG